MELWKSILKVFTANIIQLITNVVVTFFVPLVVSVNNYALIRTYTLYIGYIAFFSFGFYEGIYLKYGGKNKQELSPAVVRSEYKIFGILQMIVSIVGLAISLLLQNNVLFFAALAILPANLFTYFKRLYLAVGDFDCYKKGMCINAIVYMIFNCVLALLFRVDNAIPYYMCSIVADFSAMAFSIFYLKKAFATDIPVRADTTLLVENVKMGWLILLGNLVVNSVYSIDKWFVKFFFNDTSFAYYSFAVSLLNIVMVLVQSVALSLYNFLAKGKSVEQVKLVKLPLLCVGALSSGGFYILYYIIHWILPKYVPSLDIFQLSFASYPYIIFINSVFINLYKAEKKNIKYIKSVAFMFILYIICGGTALFLWKDTRSIAFASTISFVIWYIYCQRDFRKQYINKCEFCYLIMMMVSFFKPV